MQIWRLDWIDWKTGFFSLVDRDAAQNATQPPMLSFKTFLQDQEDNIEQEEAVKRYNDYKNDFKKTQIAEFFAAHKDEDWLVSKCEQNRLLFFIITIRCSIDFHL